MKLGVTGGRGFIGTNLLSYLDLANIQYVRMDGECFENYLNSGITHVIHLAGRTPSSQERSLSDYLQDNVILSAKVLDFSKQVGASTLLFSTYGYHPCQAYPSSAYHLSKALLENMASYYALRFSLDIQVLRLGSVYGPHQNQNSLLSNILNQVNDPNGTKIVLRNPNVLRSYISVLDVIDFLMLAVEKKNGFQIHFVGSQELMTVKDFAALVVRLLNSNKVCDFLPDDTEPESEASLAMAIRENLSIVNPFSWTPKHPLIQGLTETLQ